VADAQAFRQAWGKFATGVSVITSIQPDGHVHGMTASDINSVSLNPLLVLISIGHNRNSHPLIKDSGHFCINILNKDQGDVALYYAAPLEKRLEKDSPASFRFTNGGSAMIEGALASMDCHIVNEYIAGDHTIFIGEVERIALNSGKPLLYFQGEFGQFTPNGAAES
jgi:flavin reductase (DIM6/NTAB) family NADH-FMN oxidoreductase RutF